MARALATALWLLWALSCGAICNYSGAPGPENASWGTKCYWSTLPERTRSLSECFELCGKIGTPVCITTQEEWEFVKHNTSKLLQFRHWLGMYRDKSAPWDSAHASMRDVCGASASGDAQIYHYKCATGATIKSLKNDLMCRIRRHPEEARHCLVNKRHDIVDKWCDITDDSVYSNGGFPCLCEDSGKAEGAEQDIELLMRDTQAYVEWLRADAWQVYTIALFVGVLPLFSVLLGVYLQKRKEARRHLPTQSDAEAKVVTRSATGFKKAREIAAIRQELIIGLSWSLGWLSICLGLPPWIRDVETLELVVGPRYAYLTLLIVGLIMIQLSLLPTYDRSIRAMAVVQVLGFFFGAFVFGTESNLDYEADKLETFALKVGCAGFLFLGGAYLIYGMCPDCRGRSVPPRVTLRMLWNCIRVLLVATVAALIATTVAEVYWDPYYPQSPAGLATMVAILALLVMSGVITESARAEVHRRLGNLGGAEAASDVATIASLIGRCTPEDLIAKAERSFRGLLFSELVKEDLMIAGNTGLHSKSVEKAFGEVDAYVSHSWSDSGEEKYRELTFWAEQKTKEGASELYIWLDKACIDQTSIGDNLACLPVFIAACKELLVLLGKTYPTRLWCVMELFVYARMGGFLDDMCLLPLSDGQDLNGSLQSFRASLAACSNRGDREHLLAVIEAGFGHLDAFDDVVRQLLVKGIVRKHRRSMPQVIGRGLDTDPLMKQVVGMEQDTDVDADDAATRPPWHPAQVKKRNRSLRLRPDTRF